MYELYTNKTLIFSNELISNGDPNKNYIFYTFLSILFLSKIISKSLLKSYMEKGKNFLESRFTLTLYKLYTHLDISFNTPDITNIMTDSIYDISDLNKKIITNGDSQILGISISEESLTSLCDNYENPDFIEHKKNMSSSLISIDLNDSIHKSEEIDTIYLGWVKVND